MQAPRARHHAAASPRRSPFVEDQGLESGRVHDAEAVERGTREPPATRRTERRPGQAQSVLEEMAVELDRVPGRVVDDPAQLVRVGPLHRAAEMPVPEQHADEGYVGSGRRRESPG